MESGKQISSLSWLMREKRRSRKQKSPLLSLLSPSMPVPFNPLTCLSLSFDLALISSVAASVDSCEVTYVALCP